jgi:hypothetical protein
MGTRPTASQTLEWATVNRNAGPVFSLAQAQAGFQFTMPLEQWFDEIMNRSWLWQSYFDSCIVHALCGDASDGSATVTSATATIGTWLLNGVMQRDVYLFDLTFSGAGSIQTNGYRVFVAGTLDLTNAGAGAIDATGASGASGGIAVSNTVGGGGNGNAFIAVNFNGNNGGAGGNGGVSASTGFSSPPTSGGTVVPSAVRYLTKRPMFGTSLLLGGAGGGRGGGASLGLSGQTGGAGGGIAFVCANTILRRPSTAIGAIRANGGAGCTGGLDTFGNQGGSGGGGGGWVFVQCISLLGGTAPGVLQAAGGVGGTGAFGFGGVNGGTGGNGGNGGRVSFAQIGATWIESTGVAGSPGVVGSVSAGGAGGAGGALAVDL